jgi:hypothetical protein
MIRRTSSAALLVATLCALLMPLALYAEESALSASIRAEIQKDPRSAQMTEAELDALVVLLAQGAQEGGVTQEDIAWRAERAERADVAFVASSQEPVVCDGFPQFFCTVQTAFGFDGSNYIIPVGLLATSGLLWFLLYELRHHHRMGHI